MKVTKTYSIDSAIYNAFEQLASQNNINKSSFIEGAIRKYLKENDMDFIDKVYTMRGEIQKTVTVIRQDPTYYTLSDGSKIQKILFMQLFQEIESVSPEEFFKKNQPIVDPEKFFSGSTDIFEDMGEKIKNKF